MPTSLMTVLRPIITALLVVLPATATLFAQPLKESDRERFIQAAVDQVGVTVLYDPAYVTLKYPGGDVPIERGVCTDVVIRALRRLGKDLQVLVHTDMRQNFSVYPQKWGLKKPDRNIDHRRVPNLMCWFKRQGYALPVTTQEADYQPGDIVAWALSDGRPHIGIVSHLPVPETRRYLCVHNIGAGAQLEDVLFAFQIIGHYRMFK